MMILRRFLWIWVLIVLAIGGVIYLEKRDDTLKYRNDALGIRFSYPEAYTLEPREGSGHVLSLVLVPKNFTVPQNGEGPATINIDVYQSQLSPLEWAKSDPASNFGLGKGTYASGVADDQPAVLYRSDGLYTTDNLVSKNRDYVIHFSVGFISEDDQIRDDFDDLMGSLKLY